MSTLNGKNSLLNSIALRKAKIAYNFGLSECSRVNELISSFVSGPFVLSLGALSG